jgi:O-antigen ligase
MTISSFKNKFYTLYIILYLIVLLFFPDFKIGLPLIHGMFLCLIVLTALNIGSTFNLFKIDLVKLLLIVIILEATLTYILKSGSRNMLADNFSRVTGNRPNGLYFKVTLNGVFALLMFGFAYSYGKMIANYKMLLHSIIISIIFLCLINAVANIAQWVISTGGVIGRYNFKPPLVPSQGTSIGYSILGFLLLLSTDLIKKKIYKLLFLSLLALSILIIVTRQAQLSFGLILILYFTLKSERFSFVSIFKFFLVSLFLGGSFYSLYEFLDISDLFLQASDSDSVDFIVRLEAYTEAYRIFSEHIVFGVGYGLFSLYNQIFVKVAGEFVFLASAHNGLISIAAESGIVGVIIIFILIFIIIKKIFKARAKLLFLNHQKFNFVNAILAMVLINTISLFISNFFLFPPPSEYSYIGISFITWLFIGVSCGLVELETQGLKNA